jgi:hypothetical protein
MKAFSARAGWRALLLALAAAAAAPAAAQVSTTTTVDCTPNPSFVGQSVTCTATVTADSGGATPTGTVDFQINGSLAAGGVGLDPAGQASFTTSAMSAGKNEVAAFYDSTNDAEFTDSSIATSQFVLQSTTTLVLDCEPNPSLVGEQVDCTATVTAESGATPTGTVTFQIDGGGAAVVALDGSGQASFSTSAIPLGDHTVSADYTPDTTAFTESGDTTTQSVVQDPTTTTLDCAPNPSQLGELVTCTATVTSGSGATPTGTVTFRVDGGSAVVVGLNGSGQASFSTDALAEGTHTVTAEYGSDAPVFENSEATPFLLSIGGTAVVEIPVLGPGGIAALGLLLAAAGLARMRNFADRL